MVLVPRERGEVKERLRWRSTSRSDARTCADCKGRIPGDNSLAEKVEPPPVQGAPQSRKNPISSMNSFQTSGQAASNLARHPVPKASRFLVGLVVGFAFNPANASFRQGI